MRDSRIFEFFGWRIARGDRLYVDLWEVKPPLSFETTAAFAAVTGDPWTYHALVVLATGALVVACVLLVGAHVHDLTGDPTAAVVAGLAPYAVPAFHLRAGFGFKAKYAVVAAALGAVWLARNRRPLAAGALAAAAVAYWQFALGVPVVVLGIAAQRGRSAAARVVAGGAIATALVLAPVVWWGALDAMVVETVLVGLEVGTRGGLAGRVHTVPAVLDDSLPVVAVGLAGLGWLALGRLRARAWWAAAAGAWFLAVALALDYDTFPDLFPLLAFAAIGLGLVVAHSEGRGRRVLVRGVVVVALVNVALLGNVGPIDGPSPPEAPAIADRDDVDAPYDKAEKRALLWHDVDPPTCHVFVARTEGRWIRHVNASRTAEACGRWP